MQALVRGGRCEADWTGRAEELRGSRMTLAAGMVLTKSATHGGRISARMIAVVQETETRRYRDQRNAAEIGQGPDGYDWCRDDAMVYVGCARCSSA